MGSHALNRSLVGRAAAVLTTSEVAGASLDLKETTGDSVTVDLSFTIGSLTNVTVRHYVSMDGVAWKLVTVGAVSAAEVLTASTERCITLPGISGWRFFRTSVQGSGTVTSSSAAFTYRYLRRGAR